MNIYEHVLYKEDVRYVSDLNLPWNCLNNSSILVSGATGLIGSFLIDVIMEKNIHGLNCHVYALGRNVKRAEQRFYYCFFNNPFFTFIECDINKQIGEIENLCDADYVFHLASNTHPVQYSTDPIGTIMTNVFGLYNMLLFSVRHNTKRFIFSSSNEIYGENRGDIEKFHEGYCGYIDSNTLRAGYPESKRCGEALCQAFKKQEGLDIVIPRFTRSYGPSMLLSDTKAISQFILKAVSGKDIILKSDGMQYYSYTYVADAVAGLFTAFLCGMSGEAYNIADEKSDIRLKDLAHIIANIEDKDVLFEIPDSVESAGYSKATKARLDGSKLKDLGWCARYDIKTGVERTIKILKETI